MHGLYPSPFERAKHNRSLTRGTGSISSKTCIEPSPRESFLSFFLSPCVIPAATTLTDNLSAVEACMDVRFTKIRMCECVSIFGETAQ